MYTWRLMYLVFCLSLFSDFAQAEDFETPHRLEPGQTLSADVLNEIFDSLAYTDKLPSRDDFVGTWSCKQTSINDVWSSPPYTVTKEQEILNVINGTVVFSSDGNGNYTITEQHPELLVSDLSKIENEPYASTDGYIFFEYLEGDFDNPGSWHRASRSFKVVFRSDTQFDLFNFMTIQQGSSILCDKTNIPPAIPYLNEATISESNVILTWEDKSLDETSFKVLRRDSLEGQWHEIAEVDSVSGSGESVTYTDNEPSIGTYWYRVQSVNGFGASLGSNVITVDIE